MLYGPVVGAKETRLLEGELTCVQCPLSGKWQAWGRSTASMLLGIPECQLSPHFSRRTQQPLGRSWGPPLDQSLGGDLAPGSSVLSVCLL